MDALNSVTDDAEDYIEAPECSMAIDVVVNDSELKELWEENEEDYPKWVAILQDVKSRIQSYDSLSRQL